VTFYVESRVKAADVKRQALHALACRQPDNMFVDHMTVRRHSGRWRKTLGRPCYATKPPTR
jgi:hypothetical protein